MNHESPDQTPAHPSLEALLSGGTAHTVYQPIVDLSTGEPAACEALTRFSNVTNPAAVFELAEQTGTEWMLECATRNLALSRAAPCGGLLFLNCSPRVIADDRILDSLRSRLETCPSLSPARIVIEITERSDPDQAPCLARRVDELKALGYQIAIDDVGAGTSGLVRIANLRPHWLKLDRELVDGIATDPVQCNLVRFLAEFARMSGVRIVAEGIERADDLSTLMDIGVGYGQGYILARPCEEPGPISIQAARVIQGRASNVRTGVTSDRSRLEAILKPVIQTDAQRAAEDVREALLSDRSAQGVVVTDTDRVLGWISRDRLAPEREHDDSSGRLIGEFSMEWPLVYDGGAGLGGALTLAGQQPSAHGHVPLIYQTDGTIAGAIMPGDLLLAAGALQQSGDRRVDPLTGLPSRTQIERHVHAAIDDARRLGNHTNDALLIDIRNLTGFNRHYGYEQGDELIRELGRLVRSALEQASCQIGHLCDDVLLAIAPHGRVDALLPGLISEFDALVRSRCAPMTEAAKCEWVPRVGMRIVVLQHVFGSIVSVKDLLELSRVENEHIELTARRGQDPCCSVLLFRRDDLWGRKTA